MKGVLGVIKLDGLKAGRTCPGDDKYEKPCVGRRIKQTGKTSLRVEFPFLSGIGRPD